MPDTIQQPAANINEAEDIVAAEAALRKTQNVCRAVRTLAPNAPPALRQLAQEIANDIELFIGYCRKVRGVDHESIDP